VNDKLWYGLGEGLSFREEKTSLGIKVLRFPNDGSPITATMADGSQKTVHLPKGWKVQALHSSLIWQCPCGEFVLGAPLHDCGS
jgi:hypothetical protein